MCIFYFSFDSLADDDLVILPSSDFSFYNGYSSNGIAGLSDLSVGHSYSFSPAYFFEYTEGSQFDSFIYDNSTNSYVTLYLFFSDQSFIDLYDLYGRQQSSGGIIATFPKNDVVNHIATLRVPRNSILDISDYFNSPGYYLIGSQSDSRTDTTYFDLPLTVTNYRVSSPAPTESPSYSGDSLLVFDKFDVDLGSTIFPNYGFNVFPSSVDVSQPNSFGGYTYVLNYSVRLNNRFVYPNNVGKALSSPVVTSDIYVRPSVILNGLNFHSFSDMSVRLDSSQTHDCLNTVKPYLNSDGSGYMSGSVGYSILDMPISSTLSDSYDLVLEWSLVYTTSESNDPNIAFNAGSYSCYIRFDSISYFKDDGFKHVSSGSSEEILEDIYQEQVKEHEEEIDKANEASDAVTEGVSQVTDTLSSWEIFIMPVTLITEFVQAISGDGSSSFTFPSYSLMGYQLWPAYTFDLNVIAEKFPLLYNSLHLISGILIVIAFIRYLWRKWSILTGDDMPEGEVK